MYMYAITVVVTISTAAHSKPESLSCADRLCKSSLHRSAHFFPSVSLSLPLLPHFPPVPPPRQLDTTDSILGSTSCLTENDAQEAANEMMSAAKELELWFRKQQAFARSQRGVEVKIQTIKMELEEKNALIQATMQVLQR